MNWLDGESLGLVPEAELSAAERSSLRRTVHRELQAAGTVLCALVILVFAWASGLHPVTAVERAFLGALLATLPLRGLIFVVWWLGSADPREGSDVT